MPGKIPVLSLELVLLGLLGTYTTILIKVSIIYSITTYKVPIAS